MLKSFVLFGGICLAVIPAMAQEGLAKVEPVPASASATALSLTVHLQMQGSQIERLNRLYQRYAPRRGKQEATLTEQQRELEKAQAPITFDERHATRLLREVEKTRQRIATNFLAARRDALKVLTPVQLSQLESLANDPRIRMRDDSYYQLLVSPLDSSWQSNSLMHPIEPGRSSDGRSNANGHYGAYGGYGYGRPQYGVYGGVEKRAVGVYGGVGRGGPSIGIGIGGIFGLGRYRR